MNQMSKQNETLHILQWPSVYPSPFNYQDWPTELGFRGALCLRSSWGKGLGLALSSVLQEWPGMGRGCLHFGWVWVSIFHMNSLFLMIPVLQKENVKNTPLKLLCFRMLLHPWLMPRLGAMLMMWVSFFLHCRLVYTEGDTTVLLHTKWQNHKNLPMWGERKLSEAWVLQYMQ